MKALLYRVTFTSKFSKQPRTTIVKARNKQEAIANAKNIRPAHDFSNADAHLMDSSGKMATAKGIGAQHNAI